MRIDAQAAARPLRKRATEKIQQKLLHRFEKHKHLISTCLEVQHVLEISRKLFSLEGFFRVTVEVVSQND